MPARRASRAAASRAPATLLERSADRALAAATRRAATRSGPRRASSGRAGRRAGTSRARAAAPTAHAARRLRTAGASRAAGTRRPDAAPPRRDGAPPRRVPPPTWRPAPTPRRAADAGAWQPASRERSTHALRQALPADDGASRSELAGELAGLVDAASQPTARAATRRRRDRGVCASARRRVLRTATTSSTQLGALCRELTASLTDLAEDDSWARASARPCAPGIDGGPERARRARRQRPAARRRASASSALRGERERARDALRR